MNDEMVQEFRCDSVRTGEVRATNRGRNWGKELSVNYKGNIRGVSQESKLA